MNEFPSLGRWRKTVLSLGFISFLAFGFSSCGSNNANKTETKTSTATEKQGPDFFADVTAQSPEVKKFIHRNGEEKDHYSILESLGGGVGFVDFDKDGLGDLIFAGGGDFAGPDKKQIVGYPTKVFQNLGNWKFKDVTEEVLPGETVFYSHGITIGDYDCDGWPDLLVTGYDRLALYRNVEAGEGKRKLVEVTGEAGLGKLKDFWGTSAGFGDLDGDGYPDLYVCRYVDWSWETDFPCPGYVEGVKRDVCSPKRFHARQHALFRNNGKGGFIDVTAESGLRIEVKEPKTDPSQKKTFCGKGLGVLLVDVNGDSRPEIYVANDTTLNFLYLNKSQPGKIQLEEVGQKMGVAGDINLIGNGSMGVDVADIDGKGDPALWVTNYENEMHALYRMGGTKENQFFIHNTAGAGIGIIGQIYVGWGTGFLDLDNDGWQDLVVSNGHVVRHPPNKNLAQKPVLLQNRGDGKGKFKVITGQGGPYFLKDHRGRGLAIGDLDNDGLPDLAFNPLNEPGTILKNISQAKNNWLGVQLERENSADVIGARVVLQVGDRKQTQFQKGGGSYASARDPRLLFGLGQSSKAGKLTVYWPAGEPRIEHWDNLEINRYHKLVQGTGKKE